jgi:hypothetical protein
VTDKNQFGSNDYLYVKYGLPIHEIRRKLGSFLEHHWSPAVHEHRPTMIVQFHNSCFHIDAGGGKLHFPAVMSFETANRVDVVEFILEQLEIHLVHSV